MEDPFVGHLTLDGIDCGNELRVLYRQQLLNMRALYFQNDPSFEQHISKVCRKQRISGREFGRPRLFDEGHSFVFFLTSFPYFSIVDAKRSVILALNVCAMKHFNTNLRFFNPKICSIPIVLQ